MRERLPIRLLIADDHTLFREGLKRILEMEEDLEIVGEAGDGEEALRLVEALRPDVILMDINMPNLNGVEATRVIHERHPDAKIIVLSIHDDAQYVYRALQLGATGYLLKEVDAETLVEAVRLVARGEGYIHPRLTPMVINEMRRLRRLSEGLVGEEIVEGGKKADPWHRLTDREKEVLRLIVRGLTNRDIGRALGISDKTVKNHISSILSKLRIPDRKQLIIRALEEDWLKR
ncbi:response regulator transcription factor [Hydrogenibacillus sp. N12]|nr:response regulator transcription factor [Hydrogenibacillus sp. N12]